MPKNMNLEPIPLPMTNRRNQEPSGKVVNDLLNIKVSLVNYTKFNDLLEFMPEFVEMTWTDFPSEKKFLLSERLEAMYNIFNKKTLPTALELIRFVYLIDGINIQDVTHLLRHRTFSFSSSCTGDRDQRCHNITMPEAISNSPEFKDRYIKLMKDCIQLYADMVDSDKISMMDARLCLPKCHDTSYYVGCNLKDLLGFLNQRKDEQIQPSSDVVLALKMYVELCSVYPIACFNLIDFDAPDYFYIQSSQTEHSTRLYAPYSKNDKFEWHPDSFIYGERLKHEVAGTGSAHLKVFENVRNIYIKLLKELKLSSKKFWNERGFEINNK